MDAVAEVSRVFDDPDLWSGGPTLRPLCFADRPTDLSGIIQAFASDADVTGPLKLSKPLHRMGDAFAFRAGSLPAIGLRAMLLERDFVMLVAYPPMVERACGLPCLTSRSAMSDPRVVRLYAALVDLARRLHVRTPMRFAEVAEELRGSNLEADETGLFVHSEIAEAGGWAAERLVGGHACLPWAVRKELEPHE